MTPVDVCTEGEQRRGRAGRAVRHVVDGVRAPGATLAAPLKRALTVLRWVLNVVVLVWVVRFFLEHRSSIARAFTEVDAPAVVGAMLLVVVGLVPGARAWQRLCADALPTVGVRFGMLVYLRSAVGKYTPAGILTFVVQQRLLERAGASPALLVQVFVGTALAACAAAAVLSVPAALTLGSTPGWLAAAAAVVVLTAVLARRARFRPLLARTWTRLGLPGPRLLVRATLLQGVALVVTGAHLAALGAGTHEGPVFLVSAYALSSIVGLVFAVLPGAFGARDGALLFILATRLDPADAAMLAVLSRALVVVGDLVGAAVSAAFLRFAWSGRHPERSTA